MFSITTALSHPVSGAGPGELHTHRYYSKLTNKLGSVGLAFEGKIGGGSGEVVALAVSGLARERNAAATDGPRATELPAREGRSQ